MIDKDEVLAIHIQLIELYGGSFGTRDNNLLEAALARPFMTFDGIDLYPTPIEKAAAVMESIVKNHPFVDGNKRTGFYIGLKLLLKNGIDITAAEDDIYNFVIAIASGQMDFDGIKEWLLANTAASS